jgi:hypothetical protein
VFIGRTRLIVHFRWAFARSFFLLNFIGATAFTGVSLLPSTRFNEICAITIGFSEANSGITTDRISVFLPRLHTLVSLVIPGPRNGLGDVMASSLVTVSPYIPLILCAATWQFQVTYVSLAFAVLLLPAGDSDASLAADLVAGETLGCLSLDALNVTTMLSLLSFTTPASLIKHKEASGNDYLVAVTVTMFLAGCPLVT